MSLSVNSKKDSRPYVVFVKRRRKLFFIYFSAVLVEVCLLSFSSSSLSATVFIVSKLKTVL